MEKITEKIISLGNYIFPISFLLYVGLHFGKPEKGVEFIPDWIPFPLFWNYFTGVCILLFIVCCFINKYARTAILFMALYVFLVMIIVHLPRAGKDELEMVNLFRNIMLVGALLVFAQTKSKQLNKQ